MHTFVRIDIMVVRPPVEVRIRHLHIFHNAPYLPPPPPNFTERLFFISPWYYSRSKRNWKQRLCKILGGK